MYSGVKALMYSRGIFPRGRGEAEGGALKFEVWLESRLGSEKAASFSLTSGGHLGRGHVHRLVFLLPTLPGHRRDPVPHLSMLVRNVAESLLKIVIFVGYLVLSAPR